MSVSLGITRANGRFDDYPFSGQRSAENTIRPLAQSLGLKHVPQFPSWYPIEPEYLDEVIGELRVLQGVVNEKYPQWVSFSQDVARIIDALEELKDQQGWKASFG